MQFDVSQNPTYRATAHFAEMVQACCGLSLWCFSRERKLIDTTCREPKEFLMFLNLGKCMDCILENMDNCQVPILLEDAIGMLWAADFMKNSASGETDCILVLGPIFDSTSSLQMLQDSIRKLNFSISLSQIVTEKLQQVPVMSSTNFNQYIRMLHWNLTGCTIASGDIQMQRRRETMQFQGEPGVSNPERRFYVEEKLLQMVREGNSGFSELADPLIESVPREIDMPVDRLRQNKNLMIIFTALVARAAMQGGVAMGTASALQDHYTQAVERCRHYTELVELNKQMLDDFIRQVQKTRANRDVSRAVRECCEYLDRHLMKPFVLSQMARTLGYTEYYLSKKFYRETGRHISEYLRTARLEYAKIMLVNTRRSIQEISEELQFSSRNYFTRVFSETFGLSPREYRERFGVEDHEKETESQSRPE